MKTRNSALPLLTVILLIALLSSCHKPTQPDDEDFAEVKDNVVDISQHHNLSDPVINGDTYTYSYTGSAPSINVGDVLVGQTGFGYMRKVTTVQNQNNQIVCQTDSARIGDVINDCSVNVNAQLSLGDLGKGKVPMKQTYLAEGVSVTKDGSYYISTATLLDNVSFGTLKIKNTTLSYEPNFDLGLDMNDGEVTNLTVTATGTMTTSMTVEAYNLRSSKPLIDLPPIVQYVSLFPYAWIGPVPVFIGVELCPTFKFTIPNQLTQELTLTSSESVTVGAHIYPEFSTIFDDEVSSQTTTTVMEYVLGDGIELKVGLTPRIKVLIGGLLGPKLGPVVYLRLTGDNEGNDYSTRLYCGLDLKISMAIDALGWQMASISYTVNCAEYQIYHYTVQMTALPAPTFSPPGEIYQSPQNVALDCYIADSIIRYTTNGVNPTETSTQYSNPILVSVTTTIKAMAFKSGWNPSPIASATYTITPTVTVATPTFSPPGGPYSTAQSVQISCTTSGATIRYTTNGSDPTANSTQYSSPISMTQTTTIKAKGFKSGWTPSSISSATYTIGSPPGQMVYVPGGTFNNGTSNVTVSSFYMDKYELTQAGYQAVMGTNPSYFGGNPNNPVERVTWFNAIEYSNRRSLQEGLTPCYSHSSYGTNPDSWPSGWNSNNSYHTNVSCNWTANGYRLPTEAEWQFAARGGNQTHNYTYSGSNTIGDVAWYSSNSGSTTHTVGTKTANELGLYDMSGNVWEWNWDIHGSYPGGAQTNPHGAVSGSGRVRRGGGWDYYAYGCTVSGRYGYDAADGNYDIGLRLVRFFP